MKTSFTIKPRLQRKVENVGFLDFPIYWSYTRLLIWSLRLEKRSYIKLAARIASIWRLSGTLFLVKYLKEAFLIVQKYVSREEIHVSEYPIGIAAGLPTIIPGDLRLLIRRRDPDTIRGCLAFLALFRILKVPSILKLQTITDPFKGISDSLPSLEIGRSFRAFGHRSFSFEKPLKLVRSSAAGPNGATSVLYITQDVEAWRESPLRPSLERFITLLEGPASPFLARLRGLWESPFPGGPYKLGKLALKEEAAGKARVFAVTDSITQSVMQPLHQRLFRLLEQLPSDGTFNQGAPLTRLLKLHEKGELGSHRFHSYDLSAATDRLPISLQRDILGYYVGTEMATLWAKLLVERDWFYKDQPLRYAVGQPMGALSSWAMLALTHHYIVAIAARRVGILDFNHYAVLGDDIVIANDLVAASYYSLVTDWLGVDINLSKSLVSSDAFEFAKRLVTTTGEVTPPGPKNVLLGVKSLSGIPSLLIDLTEKGFHIGESEVDEYFKRIPSVRRRSALKELQWSVKGPFGFIPTESGLSSSMRVTSSQHSEELLALLRSTDLTSHEFDYKAYTTSVEKSHKTLLKWEERLRNWQDSYGNLALYQYIYQLYVDEFMDLALSVPIYNDNRIYAIMDVLWLWTTESSKEYIMRELKSQIRDKDDSIAAPIADPFQVERVIMPFKTSVKSFNFFAEVRQMMRRLGY